MTKNNPGSENHKVVDAKELRGRVLRHLDKLGLDGRPDHTKEKRFSKEDIRQLYADQRVSRANQESPFIQRNGRRLLRWFPNGDEINPAEIRPELVEVAAKTEMGDLFRLATQLWSIPVSRGFGRRMRFLVIDRQNMKLIGLFALGDPVFNLRVRDEWIGWDVRDREERLVNVMDAYVLGAVPPYSQLIGGKLVASLMASREVNSLFDKKYGNKRGIIAKKAKNARLVLMTTTSALGRSSIYNRLRIPGGLEFVMLGETQGYGHFHIPDDLFAQLRSILVQEGHSYARAHDYGDGPNWRFRVVRKGLEYVGLSPELLKHGVRREVYGVQLAANFRQLLLGEATLPRMNLMSIDEISTFCLDRWIIPRAARRPEFREWTRGDTWQQISRTA